MKIKKNLFFVFTIYYALFTIHYLYPAPHISGKYFKGQPRSKVKVLPDVRHLRKKGAPANVIAQTLNTIGTKKIAVIIVDFIDQSFTSGWHTQANETFTKVKQYYSEVSYNKLVLDITFFSSTTTAPGVLISTGPLTGTETPFRVPLRMSEYGIDTNDSLAQLIKDALKKTNGVVNKANYDYVMVLHAGTGNESLSNPNAPEIWSVYVDWSGAVEGFTDGTIVPEKESGASPVGVTCHEFGHQLGLPDLYYNQSSVVGKWCLMDYGVWTGSPQGSSPSHLSAWCKYFLGWIELDITSTTKRNISLNYAENVSTAFVKIPIITANYPDKEYLLLEARKKTGFDSYLPGEGLLIWRIDDDIASNSDRIKDNDINSGIPHYGVDLIEADGSTMSDSNHGDAGDPFPGKNGKTSFAPQEYNIKAFNNKPINFVIANISTGTEYCSFDIVSFAGLYTKVTKFDGISPIENVKIYIYNSNTSTTVYTSTNGTAIVELSTGIWGAKYSKENYKTEVVPSMEIKPDELLIKNIVLRYDEKLVVPENSVVLGNNYFDHNTMNKMLLRYHLTEPQSVKVVVYDISGNVVKTFDERYPTQNGYDEIVWDVKKDDNTTLAPGLYFVAFKSGNSVKVEKFIIKRTK